jgi:hypothetical protein
MAYFLQYPQLLMKRAVDNVNPLKTNYGIFGAEI